MRRIGVVGAGVMGVGVAQNLAEAGHDAVVIDIDDATIAKAESELAANTRLARLLRGAAATQTGIVTFTTDYKDLADVEFVIENATEKWTVKKDIYPLLDDVCADTTVFIVNTSAMPITRLASLTTRPDRVVGVHFMNPVPLKSVVELIPGYHTSPETVDRTTNLLTEMGKQAVTVADAPGFVSNRVLMLTINEAAYLVHEGVASAADVDRVFTGCFEHKMGPLATADMIGVDTILYSVEVLHDEYADSKYRPCPLLKKMVDAGLHGRKTGQGFFSYQ